MATEDDAREIALSLPATSEKPSYGRPGFRVKDKLFARIRETDSAAGEVLVIFVGDVGEKEALIASDSEKFLRSPTTTVTRWCSSVCEQSNAMSSPSC